MDQTFLFAFIRAHANMTDQRMHDIASRFTPCALAKGDPLLREGEVNDRYVVISNGWVRSFMIDPDGDEVTTAFTGPGQVVFDADSFFMRTPARERIVALSDVAGFELSFAGLNGSFHEFPEFREMGRAILVRIMVAEKQRMLSMIGDSAEQRYAMLVRTRPQLFQHAQLKHIASYLGVTDSSLSRIRREFVAQ